MVDLDAAGLSARELNVRLRKLAARGEDVTLLNPRARHNIAVAIHDPCRITVLGSVGYYAASMLAGAEITIDGNAGWGLGENMMSGRIVLTRSAGASVASSIRGGEMFVGGDVGARAGISMKGGTLVVGGNSGFLTGFMMQKGRIVVCGDVGDAAGDSMYEGVIYVAGKIGSMGSDSRLDEASEDELLDIWETLEGYGVDDRPRFKKIVSSKKLYHFDSLERLEKISI